MRSRPTIRYALAILTFVVPLALLAWVGGTELRRRGAQAEAAVQQQASTYVLTASRRLDDHLRRTATTALAGIGMELSAGRSPPEALLALSERGAPEVLDLLLLDDSGTLLFPTQQPDDLGLPLHRRITRSRYLQTAELLIDAGDLANARTVLERAVDSSGRQRRGRPDFATAARTRFRLGTVLRRLGEPEPAAQQLAVLHEDLHLAGRIYPLDRELSEILVLTEVTLAELQDDPEERLRLLHAIADGAYDALADDLLASVAERLVSGFTPDEAEYAAARQAVRANQARAAGREFAADYRLFLAETVRRRLRPTQPAALAARVFTTEAQSSLLVFRRATDTERAEIECGWVGLRLDLAALLAEPPALTTDSPDFALQILDQDGVAVSDDATRPPPPGFAPPVASTDFGLQLRAVPADVDGFVSNVRATARNGTILVVALFLLAGAGGVILWRAVKHELELAELKVDLVSRVSHELKTPLSLIRMYGETLSMGRTRAPEQTPQFAGIIAREAERLTQMIDRILDFSRQQAGTLTYRAERVDLSDLVGAVAEAYRPHVEAAGAQLEVSVDENLTAMLDRSALESATVNLLENAVKFTPTDAANREVRLELRRSEQHVVLEVMDRGPGIPPNERERVFDSFHRASNAGVVRGAGLGLNLVQHFARAHGGTVQAVPRDGGGTIFRMTLPLTLEH